MELDDFKTGIQSVCDHLLLENQLLKAGDIRQFTSMTDKKLRLVDALSHGLDRAPDLIAHPIVKIHLQRAASLIETNAALLTMVRNGSFAAQARIADIEAREANVGAYDSAGQALKLLSAQSRRTKSV